MSHVQLVTVPCHHVCVTSGSSGSAWKIKNQTTLTTRNKLQELDDNRHTFHKHQDNRHKFTKMDNTKAQTSSHHAPEPDESTITSVPHRWKNSMLYCAVFKTLKQQRLDINEVKDTIYDIHQTS